MLRSGACAFIMKRIDPSDLGAAIRQALDQTLFHPLRENPLAAGANGSEKDLTKRELAILNAVGAGLSNKQIAEREWLAEQTVKFHLTHIYKKLGVSSRAEAVATGCQHGLIDDLFEAHRQPNGPSPLQAEDRLHAGVVDLPGADEEPDLEPRFPRVRSARIDDPADLRGDAVGQAAVAREGAHDFFEAVRVAELELQSHNDTDCRRTGASTPDLNVRPIPPHGLSRIVREAGFGPKALPKRADCA